MYIGKNKPIQFPPSTKTTASSETRGSSPIIVHYNKAHQRLHVYEAHYQKPRNKPRSSDKTQQI